MEQYQSKLPDMDAVLHLKLLTSFERLHVNEHSMRITMYSRIWQPHDHSYRSNGSGERERERERSFPATWGLI